MEPFYIKTKTEAEDIVISTLAEVGIEGVEIQDKQPLTEKIKRRCLWILCRKDRADDGIAYLNFYLEEDADKEAILKDVVKHWKMSEAFMDIGEATMKNPRQRTRLDQ